MDRICCQCSRAILPGEDTIRLEMPTVGKILYMHTRCPSVVAVDGIGSTTVVIPVVTVEPPAGDDKHVCILPECSIVSYYDHSSKLWVAGSGGSHYYTTASGPSREAAIGTLIIKLDARRRQLRESRKQRAAAEWGQNAKKESDSGTAES